MAITYTLASVVLVSVLSFIGVIALLIKKDLLNRILILLVSFSAGALLGDAFIHLLPEAAEQTKGFNLITAIYVLSGIVVFLIIEKIILWKHCHHAGEQGHEACVANVKSFAINNIIADAVHNFIDGAIIAGSYLVNPSLGVITTTAVIFHEIPQEIGDFGVLVHGGFEPKKALFFNFISGVFAIIGAIIVLLIGTEIAGLNTFLIGFTWIMSWLFSALSVHSSLSL